jgi:hypothetical protein
MWDGFPTLLTNVGFFSTESVHVWKGYSNKKCVSALITYKWCLSSMTSFMLLKDSGSRKGFLRILLFKWIFSTFLILMCQVHSEFWRVDSGMVGRWRLLYTEFSFAPTPVGIILLTIWFWVWLKTTPHWICSLGSQNLPTTWLPALSSSLTSLSQDLFHIPFPQCLSCFLFWVQITLDFFWNFCTPLPWYDLRLAAHRSQSPANSAVDVHFILGLHRRLCPPLLLPSPGAAPRLQPKSYHFPASQHGP